MIDEEQQMRELKEMNRRLLAENTELKIEIARLRGRIEMDEALMCGKDVPIL